MTARLDFGADDTARLDPDSGAVDAVGSAAAAETAERRFTARSGAGALA